MSHPEFDEQMQETIRSFVSKELQPLRVSIQNLNSVISKLQKQEKIKNKDPVNPQFHIESVEPRKDTSLPEEKSTGIVFNQNLFIKTPRSLFNPNLFNEINLYNENLIYITGFMWSSNSSKFENYVPIKPCLLQVEKLERISSISIPIHITTPIELLNKDYSNIETYLSFERYPLRGDVLITYVSKLDKEHEASYPITGFTIAM